MDRYRGRYHLLKEYAFYYVRNREKRAAELEEARKERTRRKAIKEVAHGVSQVSRMSVEAQIKRDRKMTRKRLDRFLSLGGTLDESTIRDPQDDSAT